MMTLRTSTGTTRAQDLRPDLRIVAALTVWGLTYAGYRAYYAFGGGWGLVGIPASPVQIRAVNAVGAAIVLFAAVLPWLIVLWRWLRSATPVLGWLAAVGCVMHAMVDWVLHGLSLAGLHDTHLPAGVWLSYNHRVADLQDLFFNEPWFFVEGLLWAAFALSLVRRSRLCAWVVSAVAAAVLLAVAGVLSGLGVIGSFILA